MELLEIEIFKNYIKKLNIPLDVVETKIHTLEQLAFKYDLFLIDAFGTLYNQNYFVYPGALEMYKYLKKKGKALRLLTNAASQPVEKLLKDLWLMGFDFSREEIISSGNLLAIENKEWKIEEAYYLGHDAGISFLESASIAFSENPKDPVVIVSAVVFEKERREKALEILKMPGAKLIVLNPDPWAPRLDGTRQPVSGAFAHFLSKQTHCETYYLGKPFPSIFSSVLKTTPKSSKAIMIGDTLGTDVLGAYAAGIDSALILGRNMPRADITKDEQILGIRPTYYLII